MNARANRKLFAEGAIVAAIAAGLGMLVTEPLHRRLDDARARLESAQSAIASGAEASARAPEWRAADARSSRVLSRIRELSTVATDASTLHQRLTAIASSCGVTLDRIQPMSIEPATRRATAAAGRAAAAPASPDARQPALASTALCSIEAAGSYEAVARFLGDIESSLGISRVQTARLTPRSPDRGGGVQATIETTHWSFDLPPIAAVEHAAHEGIHP